MTSSLNYLTGKMREFVKQRVIDEMNIMAITHSLSCIKCTKGDFTCEVRAFILEYKAAYMEVEE